MYSVCGAMENVLWSVQDDPLGNRSLTIKDFVGPLTMNEAICAFDSVWFSKYKLANQPFLKTCIKLEFYTEAFNVNSLYSVCQRQLNRDTNFNLDGINSWEFERQSKEKFYVTARFDAPAIVANSEKFVQLQFKKSDMTTKLVFGVAGEKRLYESPYEPLFKASTEGRPFIAFYLSYLALPPIVRRMRRMEEDTTPITFFETLYPRGNLVDYFPDDKHVEEKAVVFNTLLKTPNEILREMFITTDNSFSYLISPLKTHQGAWSKEFSLQYTIDVTCDQNGNLDYSNFTPISTVGYMAASEVPRFLLFVSKSILISIKKLEYIVVPDNADVDPLNLRKLNLYSEYIYNIRNCEAMHATVRMNNPNSRKRSADADAVESDTKRRKFAEAVLLY